MRLSLLSSLDESIEGIRVSIDLKSSSVSPMNWLPRLHSLESSVILLANFSIVDHRRTCCEQKQNPFADGCEIQDAIGTTNVMFFAAIDWSMRVTLFLYNASGIH